MRKFLIIFPVIVTGLTSGGIMYRPEGWDARSISDRALAQWNTTEMVENREHIAPLLIEAGADAMLEGLKGNRIDVLSYGWIPNACEWAERKGGYLVFITEVKDD